MDRQKRACAYGLAAVLIWSTVASAFKITLRHLDPLQLLLVASGTSMLVLLAVLAVQGKLQTLREYSRKELLHCAALGALNPFLYYLILFKAYDLLPAQEAQPLNYTWAITLTLLSVPLLGHKVGLKDMAAILVSYFGVVVISTHGDPLALKFSNGPGVALALGSTIIWALYWIYNTKSGKDPVAGLFLNFLFGFPLVLIATLTFSKLPPASVPGLLGAAYVGVFEMGVTFVLWLKAMQLTESSARVANLIFLSPFLSLVFIRFFVGEEIRTATIAGLAFIIAGNALMQMGNRRK